MSNDLFRKLKISFYCANEVFLPLFLNQVFLVLLYFQFILGNLPKRQITPVRDNFAFFFVGMLMSNRRPVRAFFGVCLSLRGREVKVTVLTSILG